MALFTYERDYVEVGKIVHRKSYVRRGSAKIISPDIANFPPGPPPDFLWRPMTTTTTLTPLPPRAAAAAARGGVHGEKNFSSVSLGYWHAPWGMGYR